jgi:multiple antibiotic resistance protein
MSIADFAITTFATLFVAIGPVDTALVFGGLTGDVHRPERLQLALRAVLIAGGVLFGFALFGVQLLGALHVSLEAFRFAGGVLLLLQAIQLIFGHPAGLSTLTAGERREALEPGDIAIFPLAFPVIAGPAGLTAVVLLMGQARGDFAAAVVVLTSMLLCLVLTYAGMVFTDLLHQVLKTTGSNVIARLAGVVLAALASQFIFDGIRDAKILECIFKSQE